MNQELEDYLAKVKNETKASERDNIFNSLASAAIAGGLAFWAFETLAHGVLFAWVVFTISAVGNRVSGEMRRARVKVEADRIMDQAGI